MSIRPLLQPGWLAAVTAGVLGVAAPGGMPAGQASVAAPRSMTIARADDGLFYLTARVNGVPIRFIVDSGANTTVLSAADAARLGLAASGARARIETVGGGAAMRWTRLARLDLAGTRLSGVRAAVVADGPATSLLGQNVLANLGAVTQRGDRLELR